MQLRETILYRYHASHSDKVVLWYWKRMFRKTFLVWHPALSKGDDYGYFQTTCFSDN